MIKITGLSFGSVLSATFDEYKKHFSVFIRILLVLYLLPNAVLAILSQVFAYSVKEASLTNNLASLYTVGIAGVAVLLLFTIFSVLLIWLMNISIIKIVTYRRASQEVTLQKIFEDAKKSLAGYAGLSLLQGLAILCLIILLIIPGIIFSVFWSFSAYFLILENKGITESMKESKQLVKGRWWKVFGYSLLFGLIVFGLAFGAGLVISILSIFLNMIPYAGPVIAQVLSDSISMFFIPLGVIFYQIFYERLKAEPKIN